MKYFIIFLLIFIPLASSLEVDFSCPKSADYGDELSCFVKVNEVDDVYDVKFYIKGDSGGINQIFNGTDYRRADWYLKKWINSSGYYEIKLKITKEFKGVSSGEFKLRDRSGKIVVFENFEMDIGLDDKKEFNSKELFNESEQSQEISKIIDDKEIINKSEENITRKKMNFSSKKVINLTPYKKNSKEELVYVSKNEKIKDFMIYAFICFLILIIILLLLRR